MSELVPAGVYSAIITGHALTLAKTGAENYQVEFQITDGEQAGQLVRASYGFTSEIQEKFTFDQLSALGWTGPFKIPLILDMAATHSIIVKHDYDQQSGKTYVKATVRTGGVERYAADPQTANAFCARMAGKVAAYRSQNGGAPQVARPTNGAPTAQRQHAPAQQESRGFAPRQAAQHPRSQFQNDAPRGSSRNPATVDDAYVNPQREDDIPFD